MDGLLAPQPDGVTQAAAVGTGNGSFAGAVDLQHDQYIGPAEHAHKVLVQVPGAAVAVGLADQHQAPVGPGLPGRLLGGADLGGVVPVVVDQGDLPAVDGEVSIDLKAPAHALEVLQPPDDGGVIDALIGGHGNGCRGSERVGPARPGEGDGPGGRAAGEQQ